jgi:hypothetical protein
MRILRVFVILNPTTSRTHSHLPVAADQANGRRGFR